VGLDGSAFKMRGKYVLKSDAASPIWSRAGECEKEGRPSTFPVNRSNPGFTRGDTLPTPCGPKAIRARLILHPRSINTRTIFLLPIISNIPLYLEKSNARHVNHIGH
jgi:hypothetical protein